MKTGAELIADERKRQIEVEHFDQEHDSGHAPADLAAAGACYALQVVEPKDYSDPDEAEIPEMWPWAQCWWKPKDEIRNLVRAGALIAAALDLYNRTIAIQEVGGGEE